MDTYKLKLTRLQNEIFRLLTIYSGKEFNIRGIAKLLRVSPTSVSKAILTLSKKEIILVDKSKTMNLTYVKFNRDNPKSVNMKRVENLKILYESGLSEYLEDKFPGCTLVLFGSYSRGEDVFFGEMDDKNSDVDIAIVGTKEKEVNLEKFEDFIKMDININFYESWDKIHKNLKNNILNGIILSGGVEL
ncbi:MAG: nucleotidyltransferase domain-containing protein [Nanoarchaeota archaeon]|nr:nucleotidyltransferase domain-containing protein [Nanoarchaeota archaeon]